MPRVDIWIRKKDLELWNKIENKSDWISYALNAEHIGTRLINKGVKLTVTAETDDGYKKTIPLKPRNPLPKEPLDDAWSGPLFREPKKGKL